MMYECKKFPGFHRGICIGNAEDEIAVPCSEFKDCHDGAYEMKFEGKVDLEKARLEVEEMKKRLGIVIDHCSICGRKVREMNTVYHNKVANAPTCHQRKCIMLMVDMIRNAVNQGELSELTMALKKN